MKLQLIRNATMRLHYAETTILTDPMLSPKGAFMPFAFKARNPTVELPGTVSEILSGVDSVLVSHAHPDHFDKAAAQSIPKDITVFCQPGDEGGVRKKGFGNVTPIEGAHESGNVTITRTGGMHGRGLVGTAMGRVSGFVLNARNEPTVYWVGDSVMCDTVLEALDRFSPDVVVTHSGGARFPGMKPIIMDDVQTLELASAVPQAKIVAVHMESLDHCGVTREMLRRHADAAGIGPDRLIIPADGDMVEL